MSEKNNNIFSHPEVEKVLKKALSNLVQESDRGAILVAAEMINSQLEKLFEAKNSGSKTLNRKILKYPGPLSNFSARLDVAYAVGYIGKNLYSSIKILKKIRNEAAHSKSDFDLNTQKNRLKEILKLGPNIPASITSMASEYLVLSTVDRVWKNREDDNLEEPIFKSKEEIYDF